MATATQIAPTALPSSMSSLSDEACEALLAVFSGNYKGTRIIYPR